MFPEPERVEYPYAIKLPSGAIVRCATFEEYERVRAWIAWVDAARREREHAYELARHRAAIKQANRGTGQWGLTRD